MLFSMALQQNCWGPFGGLGVRGGLVGETKLARRVEGLAVGVQGEWGAHDL